MPDRRLALASFGLMLVSLCTAPANGAAGVHLQVNEAARRVDVTVDGEPFTSYVWPESLEKPVLYPLLIDGGSTLR